MNIVHIGARNLIETLYRTGSLNQISYANLSGRVGTRTHQAFANKLKNEYRDYEIESEVSLVYKGFYAADQKMHKDPDSSGQYAEIIDGLEISARCDLLLKPVKNENNVSFYHFKENPDVPFIIEVKTVNRPLEDIPAEGERLHWLQAKIYTYIYWENARQKGQLPPEQIPYAIAYVSVETLACEIKYKYTDWQELEQWFNTTCYKYQKLAVSIEERLKLRDQSIANIDFPYSNVRNGQKQLMKEVYKSISRITPLIAQAPTGTGKTISVLYPAIKQLATRKFQHIFYLTAKTSTRKVCEDALNDLRKNSGLFIRSITLMAKEQICPYHKDSPDCPFALNYYDNLPAALEELWPVQELKPDIIQAAARKHKLCAFELSLDLALNCDVIIADYNHAFNPRIQLDRFFSKDSGAQILLIDEAHNLVDRARDMYSATLSFQEFSYIKAIIPSENLRIYSDTENICQYFTQLDKAFFNGEDGFDKLEASPGPAANTYSLADDLLASAKNSIASKQIDIAANLTNNFVPTNTANKASAVTNISPANNVNYDTDEYSAAEDMRIVKTDDFRAVNVPLKNFSNLLVNWVQSAREFLEVTEDPKISRKLIELIGESKYFIRICDEFWSDAYISCARKNKKDLFIRLICLDVSEFLSKTYLNRHAAIFFSATLSPLEYFSKSFCGKSNDNMVKTLELPSPFPPENLQVYTLDYISTRYKMRQKTAAELAKTLALLILLKRGQQFIYFPSFAYMEQIAPLLMKILSNQNITWVQQTRSMSNTDRQNFLQEFQNPCEGKTVIGLVVLGGVFGEGIDLAGDMLTAVNIVSVGIPQISPERNIMAEYYNYKYHQGFNFAYLYPAINKVLQAAGRLIRSEADTGFITLIDERFSQPQYLNLLPDYWNIKAVHNIAELKEYLSATDAQAGDAATEPKAPN